MNRRGLASAERDLTPRTLRPWPHAVLLSASVALYLLLHPYRGLIHDTRLYTLLALDHLRPDLYGNDIFVRYGSQGDYALFTPGYARLLAALGPEPAALLLTLGSAVALLAAAGCLARALMPARLAWLALGLLIALPGAYGTRSVFTLIEDFATPRQLAEALVVFSLAAWVRERRILAIALELAALLVHPIMALPGAILLSTLQWGLPDLRRLCWLAVAGGGLALVAVSGWLPLSRWQFDDAWLAVIGSGSYLRLGNWSLFDWTGVANVAATLVFAAATLNGAARRLAGAMLLTCAAMLLLAWIGGDVLKLSLVTQGQAWRVLWLATLLALLLMPSIAGSCWRGTGLQRCALLLLATAWVIGAKPLALCFSVPAVAILGAPEGVASRSASPLVVAVPGVVLAAIVSATLVVAFNDFAAPVDADGAPSWLAGLRRASDGGVLPALALLVTWAAALRVESWPGRTAVAAVLLVAVVPLAQAAGRTWTSPVYTDDAREAFASWRALVPVGTDVLWAAELPKGDPAGAWLLLERPSYFSAAQSATGLFSREAALELQRRSDSLPPSIPTENPMKVIAPGPRGIGPRCRDIPTRFIVAQTHLPDAQMVPAPETAPPPFDKLKLYICP